MKESMKEKAKRITTEQKDRFSLTILFSAIVFLTLLVSVCITVLMAYFFSQFGWLNFGLAADINLGAFLGFMVAVSLVIGFGVTMLTMTLPLKPVNYLITQMNRLAGGDFSVRLKFGKTISSHAAFREVSDSFNKMAEELEGAEMLRSDFINNISHEFKTPIVSISGFAKLLRRGNLTDEQKEEYIRIIEEESGRLAYMATNVLNLTRVENQAILTDVSTFNLSEQIRFCVLLLQPKWEQNQNEFSLEFDEFEVEANEELTKQVFINLLDNAIKYSPEGGRIEIAVTPHPDSLSVAISNEGSIPKEEHEKVFNKFYQADRSHSGEGNGVGLAIVKKIVQLHGGKVAVSSANGRVTFTVTLPKSQA